MRHRSPGGSSPRMRGTHHQRHRKTRRPGIIPAYAGNTVDEVVCEAQQRDHPRVCGEHKLFTSLLRNLRGSSPRMRGTRRCRAYVEHVNGIIPAYAGNTVPRIPLMACNWDHPRVCGEHFFCSVTSLSLWDHPRVCGEHVTTPHAQDKQAGSSPRMRGTPASSEADAPDCGIIPAYAGNTDGCPWPCESDGDHPRVCGEHPKRGRTVRPSTGSSPRMRGTLRRRRCRAGYHGIIPAYAGNTDNLAVNRVHPWDHPRVCGEHGGFSAKVAKSKGSSPRMRGTLVGVSCVSNWLRIIPAYAGNTVCVTKVLPPPPDHPRVCGEHLQQAFQQLQPAGSSPRMRGTQ